MRTRFVAAIVVASVASLPTLLLAPASAQDVRVDGVTERPPPTTQPTRVAGGFPAMPAGYEISARQALLAADLERDIRARKAELGYRSSALSASIEAEPGPVWEVAYDLEGERVNLVIVDGTTGSVRDSWTGAAVDWPMARGNSGQFGHVLNAPWVWIPLAAIFILGLWDFRRWRRWAHLDLLVLLSFGISQAYFNAAQIGASVPLAYPPLLYLLARMLWIGLRSDRRGGTEKASSGLRPSMPIWLTTTLVVGLIVLRILANCFDSGVIDVGYAGVIGADRITNAQPVHDDSFPSNNRHGDTYGPANYFAYVPFELVLPWSGEWDALPAAHAAAIFFDLATIAGLFTLGLLARSRPPNGEPPLPDAQQRKRRSDQPLPDAQQRKRRSFLPLPDAQQRKRRYLLSAQLTFAWVAYPYTAFTLQSNSNDSLLAALLVWSLVAFASPLGRGVLLAAASLTKFAPLVLLPLYAAGERGFGFGRGSRLRGRWRELLTFTVAFLGFAALLLAYPAVDPGLAGFYERTLGSQLGRESPFSVWGQADLEWLQTIVKVVVATFALALAFVPSRRSLVQVAALSAALLIGVQLTLEHWFYLYIPWFLGALLFALLARPADHEPSRWATPGRTESG